MLTTIYIENSFSFIEAQAELRPFTLLIGANGSGKSNFLKVLECLGRKRNLIRHFNASSNQGKDAGHVQAFRNNEVWLSVEEDDDFTTYFDDYLRFSIRNYELSPSILSRREALTVSPIVAYDGEGTVRVLDSLKTGDREDLFQAIQSKLTECIPTIEKLSFMSFKTGKMLQVREAHINDPVPVSVLSEGTQLVIMILTILHQENRPDVICFENIDRSIHPWLLQRIVDLCFEITSGPNAPQIIATTHNPYLLNLFKGHEDSVIIVEKENGATTLTSLKSRIEHLNMENIPLGKIWFSGAVEGVPRHE